MNLNGDISHELFPKHLGNTTSSFKEKKNFFKKAPKEEKTRKNSVKNGNFSKFLPLTKKTYPVGCLHQAW